MKKVIFVLLLLLLATLAWYLFLKKYDYQFQMEVDYTPAVVSYEISNWRNFDLDSRKQDLTVLDKESFQSLTQVLKNDGAEPLELFWEFEKDNDSVTELTLQIRSSENRIANRLAIINPFHKSTYIDTIKHRVIDFMQMLKTKQNSYKVHIEDGIVESPEIDCICHSSKNVAIADKAKAMLGTISLLEDYVLNRELKLTGNPLVKVTRWDRKTNMIDFDFCFPVNLAQDIRPTSEVDFRQLKTFTAYKAIFNGNYRNSHLAWFELLEKAEKEVKLTNELPLEIFYNNPKMETTSSIEWKAEIFLPVAK